LQSVVPVADNAGLDPTSYKEILAKVSSPTDLGVIFTVGPLAWVIWVLFGVGVLPAGTFAALAAVFALGIKKLAIDARRRSTLRPLKRWDRYLELIGDDDDRDRLPDSEMLRVLRAARQFDDLVTKRLVSDDQINQFIDDALIQRAAATGLALAPKSLSAPEPTRFSSEDVKPDDASSRPAVS
jgi:hypothetical protein